MPQAELHFPVELINMMNGAGANVLLVLERHWSLVVPGLQADSYMHVLNPRPDDLEQRKRRVVTFNSTPNQAIPLLLNKKLIAEMEIRRQPDDICSSRTKPPPLPLRVKSRTDSSPLVAVPQHNRPVVDQYDERFEVQLDETYRVCEDRDCKGKLVLVVRKDRTQLDVKMRQLRQMRGQPWLLACLEVFITNSVADLVFEYVDLTLLHVAELPRLPNERELAAMAGQASDMQIQHQARADRFAGGCSSPVSCVSSPCAYSPQTQ